MRCDVGEETEKLENEQNSFLSQLILQPFRCFTYGTAHSSTLSVASPTSQLILQPFPSLHLRHSSFFNPSVASPTSQLILQPFCCFTYVTAHSPTLSIASPTPQLILQPFRRFTFVTAHSPTLLLLHLRHSSFTKPFLSSYVTGSSLTSPGEPPMYFSSNALLLILIIFVIMDCLSITEMKKCRVKVGKVERSFVQLFLPICVVVSQSFNSLNNPYTYVKKYTLKFVLDVYGANVNSRKLKRCSQDSLFNRLENML